MCVRVHVHVCVCVYVWSVFILISNCPIHCLSATFIHFYSENTGALSTTGKLMVLCCKFQVFHTVYCTLRIKSKRIKKE